MISPSYVQTLARYNQWQNQSLYRAAATLSESERMADAGAFFGSIDATLRHILWADQLWLSRFADLPTPEGRFLDWTAQFPGFLALTAAREALDEVILGWAAKVSPEWLAGSVTWTSVMLGGERTQSAGLLVVHMFNHQTHHRGQVHALLTRLDAKPDDTDLTLLPD